MSESEPHQRQWIQLNCTETFSLQKVLSRDPRGHHREALQQDRGGWAGGHRSSHGAAKDVDPCLLHQTSRSGVRTVHAPSGPTEPSLERGDAAKQLLTRRLAPSSHPGPAPSWHHFLC